MFTGGNGHAGRLVAALAAMLMMGFGALLAGAGPASAMENTSGSSGGAVVLIPAVSATIDSPPQRRAAASGGAAAPNISLGAAAARSFPNPAPRKAGVNRPADAAGPTTTISVEGGTIELIPPTSRTLEPTTPPGGTTATPGHTATTEALPVAGTNSRAAAGGEGAGHDTETGVVTSGQADASPILWIVAAVLVLLLAAGAWAFARTRRASHSRR